jgi:hypothetical protein
MRGLCGAAQRTALQLRGRCATAAARPLMGHDCNRIATKLNRRPRKRLGYRTPEECYAP